MSKPFLKWAGGKRQLLPEIRKRIPLEMDCYFEPFVGAGAVFLDLMPQRAVINDSNVELIDCFCAIRNCPDELLEILKKYKRNHSKEQYYEIREYDRDENFINASLAERAARMIYLNKTCFNGLYRVNSKGFFNVPVGSNVSPAIFDEQDILGISSYLNQADLTMLYGDFHDAVKTATPDSFVYFDPPYYFENAKNFTSYQAEGFGKAEHERLFSVFCELTQKGVRCLLSNSDSEFIHLLYRDFKIETVKASRQINRDAGGRGKIDELLISNF